MKCLVLVRHAQSEHHVRGLTGGWTDTPLTPIGREQAERVAARCRELLADAGDVRLYSSDLLRASQTAEPIARVLGIPCNLEPALREHNNGIAAGMTHEEAERIAIPPTDPILDWTPYPGAESWRAMIERISAGLDRIAKDCPDTAVIVTHGNSGSVVVQWWLQLGECCRQGVSFELDPASVSVLTVNEWQERCVLRLNDTAHL